MWRMPTQSRCRHSRQTLSGSNQHQGQVGDSDADVPMLSASAGPDEADVAAGARSRSAPHYPKPEASAPLTPTVRDDSVPLTTTIDSDESAPLTPTIKLDSSPPLSPTVHTHSGTGEQAAPEQQQQGQRDSPDSLLEMWDRGSLPVESNPSSPDSQDPMIERQREMIDEAKWLQKRQRGGGAPDRAPG